MSLVFRKKVQKPTEVRRRRPTQNTAPANKVFSYNSVRRQSIEEIADNMSAQKKRGENTSKKQTNIRLKQIAAGIIFAMVLGVIFANSRLASSNATIVVQGTPEQRILLQDTQVYSGAVAEAINDSTWNKFKITFDKKKFNSYMVKQFPELSQAQVSLSMFGGGYKVYLHPSSAVLLFTANDSKTFVVDDNGKIVSTDAVNAPDELIPVRDQSGIQPKIGSQILPHADVVAIQTVIYQLQQHGMEVESLTLPRAPRRLEVKVQGSPYYIKFSLHSPIEQQVGAYIAVAKRLQKEGKVPAEYVDARIADRVYYK